MIITFLFTLFFILLSAVLNAKPAFAIEDEEDEEDVDYELEQILEKLEDEDPAVRSEVVDYLSYCGHPKSFELLTGALKDPEWAVRKDTIKALEEMRDRKAVKYIGELINDEYWHVRKEAVRVIGLLGGKDAVEPLISLLNAKDEIMRTSAQRALVKVGNMAIEGMLSKKITERWDAAKTLGLLKDKRPLPLLMEAIKIEKDAKVKKAIEESIEILSNVPDQVPVEEPPSEEEEIIDDSDAIIDTDTPPEE